MEVRLRLGARTIQVAVVPEGDGFEARVDGVVHRAVRLSSGPRVIPASGAAVDELALAVDGRPCRAVVARVRDRGVERVLVALAGRVWTFETGEEERGPHAGAGSGTVVAPMPGKVVSVLVAVGDVVTAGQPLVVLEAMKMESTLAAEIDGRVAAVAAVAGATVTGGEVLVEITPAE